MTKKTTNNLNNTYVFATNDKFDVSLVKIIDGPLMGSIVKINNVSFPIKPDPDGNYRIKLDYDFIEHPPISIAKSIVSQVIGEIALDILEHHSDAVGSRKN